MPRALFSVRWLEVETNLCRHGARRNVVGSAEGGEEVVQRVLVGDVDGSQAETPFVPVAIEEVVLADGGVEQAPFRNARRVMVVVFRVWRRNGNELRRELGGKARSSGDSHVWSCLDAVARQTGLELLIRSKAAYIDCWLAGSRIDEGE